MFSVERRRRPRHERRTFSVGLEVLLAGSRLPRRSGMSLIEVLVVMAIIGVLMSLMTVAVQQAMAAAKRLECGNNLRQMGLAVYVYHDTLKVLPTENGSDRTFYRTILPFIEQQAVENAIQQGKPGAEQAPIRLFLCPSRRNTQSAPGKRDYGYALTPSNGSVLDVPNGMTLSALTSQGGTSNTLLLSHLWMEPATYFGGAPAGSDSGWFYFENARSIADTARRDSDPTGSTSHMGGPHAHVVPSLFADGHISYVPLSYAQWADLWPWNKTAPVDLPQ